MRWEDLDAGRWGRYVLGVGRVGAVGLGTHASFRDLAAGVFQRLDELATVTCMGKSLAWGPVPVLVLLLAGACSNSADPAGTTFVVAVEIPTTATPDSTVAATPATTTTAAAATSAPSTSAGGAGPLLPAPIDDAAALTDPDAPPPPVDLRAETWSELVGVWADIDAYWTWLNAHPTEDVGMLSVIMHPDGPELEKQTEVYSTLVANGWRIVAASTLGQVVGFGCCPDPELEMASGRVRLLIETRAPDGEAAVVGPGGTVEEEFAGWDRKSFSLELTSNVDGDWLVWLLE